MLAISSQQNLKTLIGWRISQSADHLSQIHALAGNAWGLLAVSRRGPEGLANYSD